MVLMDAHSARWLDRNVYRDALVGTKDSPKGDGSDTLDQPGLKAMTLKAIDILQARQKDTNNGWLML